MMFHILLSTLFSIHTLQSDSVPSARVDAVVVTRLINQVRSEGCKCGDVYYQPAGAVKWSTDLAKVAEAHSIDMQDNKYFSHISSKGVGAGERLSNAGYSWKTYGENIAQGHTSEQEVVQAWIKSPGHCRNLMGAAFMEFGVGRRGNYWTMEVATR